MVYALSTAGRKFVPTSETLIWLDASYEAVRHLRSLERIYARLYSVQHFRSIIERNYYYPIIF